MAKTHIQDDINYGELVTATIGYSSFYIDERNLSLFPETLLVPDMEVPELRTLCGSVSFAGFVNPISIYFSKNTDVASLCIDLSLIEGVESVSVHAHARILGRWEKGSLAVRRSLEDFYSGLTEKDLKEVEF